VGIAISYRPLADVKYQPIQQKLVKRLSHDGLLVVMPYTNFVPGLWQIDCYISVQAKATSTDEQADSELGNANETPPCKRTVKFDVIPISSDFGTEWQYSDPEGDLDENIANPSEPSSAFTVNVLGIEQTEPKPLSYSSPILDIAEHRSNELMQSMFEEFALFNDELEEEIETSKPQRETTSDRLNFKELLDSDSLADAQSSLQSEEQLQPRILLRLQQHQYIVNDDNSFNLVGDVYTNGEIEVSLRDPQTLEVLVHQRYAIANTANNNDDRNNRNPNTVAIPFAYTIAVPPPSKVQVLIGEVQIHPQQNFPQYGDLLITQQVIAVSYPASRVLPEMLKEVQKYQSQDVDSTSSSNSYSLDESSSYPQSPKSFPQVARVTENLSTEPAPKAKPVPPLSLPPLPSNKPKSSVVGLEDNQYPPVFVSLPPLPPLPNKDPVPNLNLANPPILEDFSQSFPQGQMHELRQTEAEFARTDFVENVNRSFTQEDEPELFYSFEEELPQEYEELLEQPKLESQGQSLTPLNPPISSSESHRSNRFLNKLQTLSAEVIAAQKASQRTEELLLDHLPPADPLSVPENLSSLSINLDHPKQAPLTIAEEASLAELDRELDLELDRLLAPEPEITEHLLNEYVWEESVDPHSFPIANKISSTLSETAQTIRNIQESSSPTILDQEPVPIPELIVPAGEIISGTPMIVTVRLPTILPKYFVKFWIKDLQTRTIIDGPRWLLDFSVVPNSEFIETRTNISIPLSSVDVAFEAIAIEAKNQRESHKVRVTRAVAPPNLAQDI
ncbi:MAG: hypothetical protein ACKPCM_15875, partial [Pseudanabaena sp.]